LLHDLLHGYALCHAFETVAGETGDQPAVDRIMGHEDAGNMATVYREWRKDAAEDTRLRRVVDHVRAWLGPAPFS
jgi:integrase